MVEDANSPDQRRADRAVRWLLAGPQIDPHNMFVFRSLQALRSERPQTVNGPTMIPFTKIVEYGRFYDMTRTELDRFVAVIRLVDAHELSIFRRAVDRDLKKKTS